MDNIQWHGLDAFFEHLKDKRVFLFGAGIQGERMGKFMLDKGLFSNMIGYIDNKKHGSVLKLDSAQINIYSIDDVASRMTDNTVIIITAFSHNEIYKQLEKCDFYHRIEVYSYAELAHNVFINSDYSRIVKDYTYPVIPKKIHYVWVGGEKPKEVVDNISNWKKYCPDFEIVEWNEKNYDMNKITYLREAYESKLYGYVPDYLRLDVLYKYGGIYLDTDIELKRSLDELLYQDCFGCVDSSFTLNLGSGFGAKPGCEIIRKFRDYYNSLHFRNSDGNIDRRSCNSHQYEVLRKLGYKTSDKFQCFEGMNIYPAIFQGRDYLNEESRVNKKTFWIHWGNLSWFSKSIRKKTVD